TEFTEKQRGFNTFMMKDSYKMIICPLVDFPKHLGIECGSKGVFPYHANHPEFYGKEQDGLPPEEYSGKFNKKKRAEYEEHKASLPAGYRFNMEQELLQYCR
ncbi:hypothetical protein PENTCL1PPCAC_16228, partial [Pristionchus entomophagus]